MHYRRLVDLLGQAGKSREALNLVKGMLVEPNDTVLGALLGACGILSNIIMAERMLELVEKLNSVRGLNDDAYYMLHSNIYISFWKMAQG